MKRLNNNSSHAGFNLIELMVTLLLSSICMQLLYTSSFNLLRATSVGAERLDALLKSQQLSYWLESTLAQAGRYNSYDQNNRLSTARQQELEFITRQPIAKVGSFVNELTLGALDDSNDVLVINLLANSGCNGQSFNYAPAELFHVVEQIYIEDNELRCRSYDGRYLTGISKNHSSFRSVGLLQGIAAMQVKYMVKSNNRTLLLDANELQPSFTIKAVKLELWLPLDKQIIGPEQNVYHSWLDPVRSFNSELGHQRLLLVIPVGADYA